MSNTKETPESSQKRNSYVDDFLESGRKKARSTLTQDNQHIEDLEYMLKSVRALVKIINEIWDNREEHLSSSGENNSPLTFQRKICKEAKVHKEGRNLTIKTQKVSDTKDFGSPPAVPEDMRDLIHVNQAESDVLPDYNRYLEKSSILCKDVLLPFLTSFQEHLKETQVFLGKIEEWLIEPEIINSFLSQTFNGPRFIKLFRRDDPSKILLYGSNCLDVDSRMESKYNLCTEKGRDRLKAAFAFVKTFEPIAQIEVKDAGEEAVNGTYTLSGVFDGVYLYTRSDIWDGKHAEFFLVRFKSRRSSQKIMWCIYCEYKNQTGNAVKFYYTKGTGEEYELPPLDGWGNGVYPPPQILYKIDDRNTLL